MTDRRICVYPGTFDPITNGHESIIRRLAELFDEVCVVIAVNPRKNPMFSAVERKQQIQACVDAWPSDKNGSRVRVEIVEKRLIVQWAHEIGARWLIRGLRNTIDFEYERQLRDINHRINPCVETIYMPCDAEDACISSGMVRDLVGIEGWQEQARHYVSEGIVGAMFRKHVEVELRARFHALWNRMGAQLDANPMFDSIFEAYSQPHREYHTWQHLYEVLTHFDRVKQLCVYPDGTEFGLWMHDFFYELRVDANNEERSEDAAGSYCLDAGFEPNLAEHVRNVVNVLSHNRAPKNIDERCAVDCDLLILGQTHSRYSEYVSQIQDEYCEVPRGVFIPKRLEILRRFVNRDQIYYTPVFKEEYEDRARENLRFEIEGLQACVDAEGL